MHPKLAQQFATRHKMFESGEIDWALGEAMAYGSLLVEGTSVRLSGQDSRRGTFSHRHATLVDYETSAEHTPLKELGEGHGSNFWVYDSLLSEYAVLGFEYGYSIANPKALVLGKPSSATSPTEPRSSSTSSSSPQGQVEPGLRPGHAAPHGFEGQGPEHSSAASNGSWSSRPKTTCTSVTPRQPPSSSI